MIRGAVQHTAIARVEQELEQVSVALKNPHLVDPLALGAFQFKLQHLARHFSTACMARSWSLWVSASAQ